MKKKKRLYFSAYESFYALAWLQRGRIQSGMTCRPQRKRSLSGLMEGGGNKKGEGKSGERILNNCENKQKKNSKEPPHPATSIFAVDKEKGNRV